MIDAQEGRCSWAEQSASERLYHDHEWGCFKKDDRTLFEFMVLESAQAGLSWRTVLEKRAGYRYHYENFEPERVAQFGLDKIEQMLADPGVIRNRAKIEASINNAQRFLEVSRDFSGFAPYLLGFNDGKVKVNHWCSMAQVPASTPLSDAIAKDLKKRGFRFFGTTIVYAYLQACGFVNDHLVGCPVRSDSLKSLDGIPVETH